MDEWIGGLRPTVYYQLSKLYRRHKWALATAGGFVLMLAVSACVSTAQAIKNKSLFTAAEEARLKEMTAKQRESELRRIAETERDRSQRLLYVADMNLAKRAWDEANLGRMGELLYFHRPQQDQPDLRNFEWFYLDRLCHGDLLTFKGHTNAVWSVKYSPDGKRLASACGDGPVKVWDAASGQEILTLKGSLSPDWKRLVSLAKDKTMKLWDATSGQEILTLKGHTNPVWSVAFSPDGKRLASAGWDRTLKVWDATTGQETLTLQGHSDQVMSGAFSLDGKRLASASRDGTVKVWDARPRQQESAPEAKTR